MATFFDTSKQDHKKLLHESVRNHSELDNVVDKVERMIEYHFTQRQNRGQGNNWDFFRYEDGDDPNNDIEVRLVGYDQEDPSNSKDKLKEAFRRTIADVVSYVLRNYDNPSGVESIKQGGRSWSGAGSIPGPQDWPDGWNWRLKNHDARVAQYGI